MREILFRGKDTDEHWQYGDYIRYNEEFCNIKDTTIYRHSHLCRTSTIGQHTSLTDKNGIKIFEGDIVESRASENKEDWKRWQVIFYDGSYCFERDNPYKRKHKHEQNLLCEDEIELYGLVVVGNIHDNPELLNDCYCGAKMDKERENLKYEKSTKCNQVCEYNSLDGCVVRKRNGVCPLLNVSMKERRE